jgi:hypothetical protein
MITSRNRRTLAILAGSLALVLAGCVFAGLIALDSWSAWLAGATVDGSHPDYIPPKPAVQVDGQPGEWAGDGVYADMPRAGNPNKPTEAHLYLRYECTTGTVYAYVASAGPWPLLVDGEAWIKIEGRPVAFDQFAWVDPGYDGDSNHARGWEAAFALSAEDYALVAHSNTFHDGESQAARTPGAELSMRCGVPVSLLLNYFEAEWAPGDRVAEVRDGQGVALYWQTAVEVDTLGFNLYRGPRHEGPWTQVNQSLIPSQVPPGSPTGATYQWLDANARQGKTYFYLLEGVNTLGQTTRHGPTMP